MGYSLSDWCRDRVDFRDGRRCAICGLGPPDTDIGRHHIHPRREGGPGIISNIITLCQHHHQQADDGKISPAELYEIVNTRNAELNWSDSRIYGRRKSRQRKVNRAHSRGKYDY